MYEMNPIIAIVLAYLVGAIPFGLLIARAQGVNIRTQGSGNIGATNVLRILGKKWGIITLLLDALKGYLPTLLYSSLMNGTAGQVLAVGVATVIGHTFPVYIRFKGGKGVATSAGMLLALAPEAIGVGLLVWILCMIIWRIVSLASIVAALAVALTAWVVPSAWWVERLLITLVSVLIIWLHRSNVVRLLQGNEHQFKKKGGLK